MTAGGWNLADSSQVVAAGSSTGCDWLYRTRTALVDSRCDPPNKESDLGTSRPTPPSLKEKQPGVTKRVQVTKGSLSYLSSPCFRKMYYNYNQELGLCIEFGPVRVDSVRRGGGAPWIKSPLRRFTPSWTSTKVTCDCLLPFVHPLLSQVTL